MKINCLSVILVQSSEAELGRYARPESTHLDSNVCAVGGGQ